MTLRDLVKEWETLRDKETVNGFYSDDFLGFLEQLKEHGFSTCHRIIAKYIERRIPFTTESRGAHLGLIEECQEVDGERYCRTIARMTLKYEPYGEYDFIRATLTLADENIWHSVEEPDKIYLFCNGKMERIL